jgi:HlyD family secretion protein
MSATPDSVVDTRYAPQTAARSRWTRVVVITSAVVLALVALVAARGLWMGAIDRLLGNTATDSAIFTVAPTTLNVTLKEEGEIKPVNSIDIKCEVQSQGFQGTVIRWIIPESTRVKKGDLLVELGAEDMRDRVDTEEMELSKLARALEEAQQSLTITRSENESLINKAEIDLKVAELELQRYLEGDYINRQQSIEINIMQTRIDLDQMQDEFDKHVDLLKQDFVTQARVNELRDSVKKLKKLLEKYELELEILDDYELPKNKMQKESAVERAKEELERERQRAESREKQADARVAEQQQTLEIRQQRFERLKEQLDKCRIEAPVDGVVQYGDSGNRWRRNPIAPGEQVQQGQTLITIPDTSQMMVTTRIHEADRHKVEQGMTCVVKVPAVPGETFLGKVTKIAKFADSERSWWNPELKEHATEILLDQTDAPLSPGDSASVEILIEELQEVLAVPVQCVFSRGAEHFVFVQDGMSVGPVPVELGSVTTTMVQITAGLEPGVEVVMAPDERLLAMLPAPSAAQAELGRQLRKARKDGK